MAVLTHLLYTTLTKSISEVLSTTVTRELKPGQPHRYACQTRGRTLDLPSGTGNQEQVGKIFYTVYDC